MGIISITNCRGLPSNIFLSIQNTHNDQGSNTTRWRGWTMPSVAKLLSIFTKKIKPKGSLRPLSIPAYKMSPTIKSIAQQLYDTINCQRCGYNINNKLSGVANEGHYSIFHLQITDQQLANDWPILCHFLSVLLARISVFGHTWL